MDLRQLLLHYETVPAETHAVLTLEQAIRYTTHSALLRVLLSLYVLDILLSSLGDETITCIHWTLFHIWTLTLTIIQIQERNTMRGKIWQKFLKIDPYPLQNYVYLLSNGKSPCAEDIAKDIDRTFNGANLPRVPDQNAKLERLLNAYFSLKQESKPISQSHYIQGMNLIAGSLLHMMPEGEKMYFMPLVRSCTYIFFSYEQRRLSLVSKRSSRNCARNIWFQI